MQRKKSENSKPSAIKLPPQLPEILLDWYDRNARPLPWRLDTDPYHVWISEIMLQQTGVEVVTAYYARFLEAFPTIQALAAADEQAVLKLWEGLGYYSRARNLLKTARIIVHDYNGIFPNSYGELKKLPGIGDYTAGAIASICFDEPIPAVDGNVVRVISRICGIYDEITPTVKKEITAALQESYPARRCGDFSQSLMELGATVCIPNGTPKCISCPVVHLCAAYQEGTALMLPLKSQKQAKKQQELTVFVLSCGDTVAVRKRDNTGLLAGLWELPNVPGKLCDTDAVTLASAWGTKPASILKSIERSHIFTHIKWDMVCYYIQCREQVPGLTWVNRAQLLSSYAMPTAFKKFLDHA